MSQYFITINFSFPLQPQRRQHQSIYLPIHHRLLHYSQFVRTDTFQPKHTFTRRALGLKWNEYQPASTAEYPPCGRIWLLDEHQALGVVRVQLSSENVSALFVVGMGWRESLVQEEEEQPLLMNAGCLFVLKSRSREVYNLIIDW